MTPEMAIDLFKNLIVFALYMVAPFLIVTIVVGLLTSMAQSVTSIQEATLTFAPKLLALGGLCVFLGPWVLRSLSEFAIRMLTQMGTMGH